MLEVLQAELPTLSEDKLRQMMRVLYDIEQPPPPPLPSQPPEPPKKKRVYNKDGLHGSLRRFMMKHPEGCPLTDIVAEMRFLGKIRKSDPDQKVQNALKKSPLTFLEREGGIWILKMYAKR
jgi:hypothetical protein